LVLRVMRWGIERAPVMPCVADAWVFGVVCVCAYAQVLGWQLSEDDQLDRLLCWFPVCWVQVAPAR
jgi:hypothetical protein